MTDLEDDISQAHYQIDTLMRHVEANARIRHYCDEEVTLDLGDGSYTEINLRPVQRLLNVLRGMV